jgi:hypothetical protein
MGCYEGIKRGLAYVCAAIVVTFSLSLKELLKIRPWRVKMSANACHDLFCSLYESFINLASPE